jgi:hypothetical protein
LEPAIINETAVYRAGSWAQQALRSGFVGRQKVCERPGKGRQIVLDGIPNNGRPQIPVGMDCEVAEIDHLPLGDFRVQPSDIIGHVVSGFADDGQVVNHRIHDLFVVFEGIEINACNIALDFGDGVEDVLDSESSISRRHG